MPPTLNALLKAMVEQGGSDLHVTTNSPPQIRVDGVLRPLNIPPLTPTETKQLCYSILTDNQKHRLEETLELDLSFGIKGLARFRANVFHQRGAVAGAFRQIPLRDPQLPRARAAPGGREDLREAARAGAGHRPDRLGQVDDARRDARQGQPRAPRAHRHHRGSGRVPAQPQELHRQPARAARRHPQLRERAQARLRQDPDVVLIGEMRDFETVESALRIAETGHLTFATLHTNSAVSTINRIIDVFPATSSRRSASSCRFVLEGILCQSLLPKATGKGRALALEILVPNAAIRNLIREDKVHQIYGMMQAGQAKYGMQTFNQSLASLYFKRMITLQTALGRSSYPDELQEIIARGPAALNPNLVEGQGAAVANRS
jgi:twitching motility protein PilT